MSFYVTPAYQHATTHFNHIPLPHSNVDIGIKIELSDDKKFFVTQTAAIKPTYKVTSCTLYILCCLLEQRSLVEINKKLHGRNGSIQFSYLRDTAKIHSVELGE